MPRKPTRKNYKKRPKRTSKKVSKPILMAINKAISRQAETKVVVFSGAQIPVNCNAAIPVGNINPMPILMAQGPAYGQRIGNKITIRKILLRGYATVATNASSPYPVSSLAQFNLRMFMGFVKSTPTSLPTAADMATLLRSGGSGSPFGNDLLSLMKPVNKDWWNIKRQKQFKIGLSSGNGATSVFQGWQNNDYRASQRFSMDVTKCYPKVIRYLDNVSVNPINSGMYIFAGATDIIGSPTAYGTVANIYYEFEVYYDDE